MPFKASESLAPISDDETYRLADFLARTGLGRKTLREALHVHGVELPRLRIGRVHFVKGKDGNRFIEKLAAAQARARAAARKRAETKSQSN